MTAVLEPVAAEFDLDRYLASFDPEQLVTTEGRMLVTALDPMAFSLVYLTDALRTHGVVSFGEHHLQWASHARSWIVPGPRRDAWVAPRGGGKSTWWFGIIPLWLLAFGHAKFIAAFSDTATQSELHLQSIRMQLDHNQLLRQDFPALCEPLLRTRGQNVSDNRGLYVARSGVSIMARGIDSSTLGAKVGNERPDVLIFDDIEPPEAGYSAEQRVKRLATLQNVILPMNPEARVAIVGTTVMPGSLVHALVKTVLQPGEPPEEWIDEEGFTTHYAAPILANSDGTECSVWPERWPLEWLTSQRHTRSYKLNFENDPLSADGAYWVREDFVYGKLTHPTRHILSVDPAVTTRTTSDWTGLAVIAWQPPTADTPSMVEVRHAEQVRLVGTELAKHVATVLVRFPEIAGLLVEVNQGGDLWPQVFRDVPVKVEVVHQSEPKEVRAARALTYYQRGRVLHARQLPVLEEQLIGFPKAGHDDVLDAVVSGVLRFLSKKAQPRAVVESRSYL